MEPITALSITNPLVIGALITTALKFIQPMLKKVDDGKMLEPYKQKLHAVMLVLTFLASAIQMGLSGNLAGVDLQSVANFLTFYIPTLLGAKAMALGNQEKKSG